MEGERGEVLINIQCEYLENLYMKSNYIHQMFITGDPLRDYVVAVVVPSSSVRTSTQKKSKKNIK